MIPCDMHITCNHSVRLHAHAAMYTVDTLIRLEPDLICNKGGPRSLRVNLNTGFTLQSQVSITTSTPCAKNNTMCRHVIHTDIICFWLSSLSLSPPDVTERGNLAQLHTLLTGSLTNMHINDVTSYIRVDQAFGSVPMEELVLDLILASIDVGGASSLSIPITIESL